MSNPNDRPWETPEDKAARSKNSMWWLWLGVGVVFVMFVGCVAAVTYGGGDDAVEVFSEDEARYACEEFVTDQLKSPGTAEFTRPTVTGAGVDTFEVVGSVDAQNSFGATVRIDYTCTVRGEDGTAYLVDLQHAQR